MVLFFLAAGEQIFIHLLAYVSTLTLGRYEENKVIGGDWVFLLMRAGSLQSQHELNVRLMLFHAKQSRGVFIGIRCG